MKSRKNLLEQLKSLPYFNKNTVYQLGKQIGLKDATVDTYISRFLRRKEIFKLKNGLYISADFFYKNKDDISYLFYLANITRPPSYVSSWTALQYYDLITDVVYPIISISPKITREYKTKAGNFVYHSINKDFFSDFSLIKGKPDSRFGKFDFFIASPSKALFDLLYFKTRRFQNVKFENIIKLIEELRIDIDEMDKNEQEKFYIMIKKYFYERKNFNNIKKKI